MKLKSYLRGLGLGMIVTTIILVVTIKAANHEMTDAEIISKARELGMVETSLYANGNTTEEIIPENVTTKAPSQEVTTGEHSGEGMLAQETTAKPESTTPANQSETTKREETTTKKPETTTAAKPQSTTATKPESTTPAKPESTTPANQQETTAKREEPTTGKKEETTTAKPETTTAAKPESTTPAKPESTTPAKPEKPTTGSNEIVLVFEDISSADKASRILYDAGLIQDVDSFNNYLSSNGYERNVGEGTFTFTKGMSFEEIAKIITHSR